MNTKHDPAIELRRCRSVAAFHRKAERAYRQFNSPAATENAEHAARLAEKMEQLVIVWEQRIRETA